MIYQKAVVRIFSFSIIYLLSGCSNPIIESFWLEDNITIDGYKNDWKGSLKYYEDEKVAIAVSNDEKYMFLCLTTSDKSKIMKILGTGFTVWFDPQDSDGETIGIQYPIKRGKNVNNDIINKRRRPEFK